MDVLMKALSIICLIGALNWGLVGLFGFDLVAFLFGVMSVASRIIYSIIGISAVLMVILAIRNHLE